MFVTQSYEGGEINKTELAYLENILAIDTRQLEDIMIQKANVIILEKNQTLEQIIDIIEEFQFTRYPSLQPYGNCYRWFW